MLNRVILVGRLTKDVEIRKTTSGKTVGSFTVAIDKIVKEEKSANFFPCTIWEKGAENLAKFTHKGSLVAIEGHLDNRSYTNKKDEKVTVTEILVDNVQFLEPKSKEADANVVDKDLPF